MLDKKANVIFAVIKKTFESNDNELSISKLCKAAGVSKSGYYYWLSREDYRLKKENKDRRDFSLILEANKYRGYDKGIRGIHMRLLRMNPSINMNLKKISRLMKKYGLKCKIRKANPYRRMAKAMKTDNYASNILDRNFDNILPRKALLTDITYIPFKDYFIYLSTILDACTKEVLAYQYSLTLQLVIVEATLDKLEKYHKEELYMDTLLHSDQGCHYTSKIFIDKVTKMGLVRSMSRRGNCWDNAPQESFFGHMKDEIGDKIKIAHTNEEVYEIIDNWMSYYNYDRPIWKLGKRTPVEYYFYRKNNGDNNKELNNITPINTSQREKEIRNIK